MDQVPEAAYAVSFIIMLVGIGFALIPAVRHDCPKRLSAPTSKIPEIIQKEVDSEIPFSQAA